MQPVIVTRPMGIWENMKHYANEPKIWAVISLTGIIAGVILKVHVVAVLSIYVFGASLISLYERYKDTKALERVVQKQADYHQWLVRLEGIIAPQGGVIRDVEDIELPADFPGFLDCVNAGCPLYLPSYQNDHAVDDFRRLLVRHGMRVEMNRMIRGKIFTFYQNARRQVLDYQAKRELYEANVHQGMRWI